MSMRCEAIIRNCYPPQQCSRVGYHEADGKFYCAQHISPVFARTTQAMALLREKRIIKEEQEEQEFVQRLMLRRWIERQVALENIVSVSMFLSRLSFRELIVVSVIIRDQRCA